MTDRFTPVVRALVAASLLLATATLMLVAVNTARAAGALAIGACGAFGEAYDFPSAEGARKSALTKCHGEACRVVADFVAKVGDGKNEATISMSLARLRRPLHLAAGP